MCREPGLLLGQQDILALKIFQNKHFLERDAILTLKLCLWDEVGILEMVLSTSALHFTYKHN